MPIEEQNIKNRDDLTIQDLRVNDLIALDGKRYTVVAPYFGNSAHVVDTVTTERREIYANETFKWLAYLGKPNICEGEWRTRQGEVVSVLRNHYEHRVAFPFMYISPDFPSRTIFLAHACHGSTPAFDLVSPCTPLQTSEDSRDFEVGQVWKTRSGQEATIRRVLRNGNLECFRQDEKRPWDANWLGMSTRSQDDLVEYLRESEMRYLQVGKHYRRMDKKIVTIVSENPYKDNEGVEYGEFGFAHVLDPSIVALVEDEPAKQRPPFALGQVWRMTDGQEMTIVAHDDSDNTFLLVSDEDGDWFYPAGTMFDEVSRGVVAVEYLRETDRPRLEVSKKYRTAKGDTVTVIQQGQLRKSFCGDNDDEYHQFGFTRLHCGDPIVALVEDEPANHKQKEKQKGTEPVTETGKSKKNRSVGTPIHYAELHPGDLVRVKYDDKIWIEAYVDVAGDAGANYINRDTDLDISDCEDEVRLLQRGALPKLRVGQQWQRVDGEVVVISKSNVHGHFLTERGDCYTTPFYVGDEAKDFETCLNQNTMHSDESYEVIKLNDSIILFDKNTQQEIIAPVGSKNILQTLSNFATAVCGEPTVLAPLSSIKIIEK